MRIGRLAVATLFAGSIGIAGYIHAQPPTAPDGGTVKMEDPKEEIAEVQHLRLARKHLAEAKDAFEKDPVDAKGHRKEIMEGIDKAVKAVDDEIDEYLKK